MRAFRDRVNDGQGDGAEDLTLGEALGAGTKFVGGVIVLGLALAMMYILFEAMMMEDPECRGTWTSSDQTYRVCPDE